MISDGVLFFEEVSLFVLTGCFLVLGLMDLMFLGLSAICFFLGMKVAIKLGERLKKQGTKNVE